VARAAAREFERAGFTAIRFTESEGSGNPAASLRTISRASAIIAEKKPERIVVCLRSPLEELPMCELFEQQIKGVPVETGHEAYERLTGKIFLDERTTLHLLLSHAGLGNRVYSVTKRVVSAVVAAMALVVTLPVMALIALSIYVMKGGPVLFVQERVGLHGRPFRLLKFRSMRVGTGASSEWERDNEERITPLGRWLRRFHLDELPQLWNILRGDMDLVGPRPHPLSNHELFARSIPYYSLRSLVRPGLTGWAQVRQGYAHDLPGEIEKMRYDLCAIARPSLLRDLRVLLSTAKIVLVGPPPIAREAFPAVETKREDELALPFGAGTARVPRHRHDPKFARSYPTASARELDTRVVDPRLARHPDGSMADSKNAAMASVSRHRSAPLLAAVVVLSIVVGTLRLIAEAWIDTRPDPSRPATATAMRPSEPASPTAVATAMTTVSGELGSPIAAAAMETGLGEPTSPVGAGATAAADVASIGAAAARAKAVVKRYEISNARVRKSVLAKRIGSGSAVHGPKRPRYQAEVDVEIPRAPGNPIQRKYFVTLQYVGSGEWQIERAIFATRY
jgi:lipopolysaccharide/colanic/teichoic acid biosynthesis glycosyltransferase